MNKKARKRVLKMYMGVPWTYEFIPSDGGFFVNVKELPGCMSQGDDLEHAWFMIRDALKWWLKETIKSKEWQAGLVEIPMPPLENFG
jgi:antitoxin HicB